MVKSDLSDGLKLSFLVTPAEAALAGIDVSGVFSVSVKPSELSPEARKLLASLLNRNVKEPVTANFPFYGANGRTDRLLAFNPDVSLFDVKQWLEDNAAHLLALEQSRIADEQAQLLHRCNAVKEWCAKPDSEIVRQNTWGRFIVVLPLSIPENMRPLVTAREELALVYAAAQNAIEDERIQAKALAVDLKNKAAEDLAQLRTDELKQWVEQYGTDGMKKRAARGLLSEADCVDAMRDWVFVPLNSLARFKRLTRSEVMAALGGDESDSVDFATRDAMSATDADVLLMDEIEALLPGCSCELKVHAGWLDSADSKEDPEFWRHAVKVNVTHGSFVFSREYESKSGGVTNSIQ